MTGVAILQYCFLCATAMLTPARLFVMCHHVLQRNLTAIGTHAHAGQINDNGNAGDGSKKTELLCGGCTAQKTGSTCPRHGTDYIEWKCRYCCSLASFFCFGTTHMCKACHDRWQQRPGSLTASRRLCTPVTCPMHVTHSDHGQEFCLGCAVCRTHD